MTDRNLQRLRGRPLRARKVKTASRQDDRPALRVHCHSCKYHEELPVELTSTYCPYCGRILGDDESLGGDVLPDPLTPRNEEP